MFKYVGICITWIRYFNSLRFFMSLSIIISTTSLVLVPKVHKELSVKNAEAVTRSNFFQFYNYLPLNRLLNANKINCLRVDAFQDLHNLNLLSLYDNKLQTIAKGTFSPLRAIQTLYVCSCLWLSQVWLHILQCSKSTGHCWDQREIMCDIIVFFLHERHLAQNPFICDCHLKWLADYLHTNPIETSGARCTSPRRLANKRIGQIKSKKFRCSGNFLSSAAIFPLLAKKIVVIEVLMKAAVSLQNY